MRHGIWFGFATLLTLATAAPAQLAPRLAVDLATTPRGSTPYPMIRIGSGSGQRILFGADTARQGRELFVSDGTAAGTMLILDLNPGPASGLVLHPPDVAGGTSMMLRLGEIVLFAGDDGIHGTELWATDGTAAGTHLVKDINPGPASSFPRNARLLAGDPGGNVAHFTADDGLRGLEPWMSDGTETGTQIVGDVVPGSSGSNARAIGADSLGYYLTSFNPARIWKKNIAFAGAVVLHNSGVDDDQAAMLGSKLLFAGRDPTALDVELWSSEGTPLTTARLVDILPSGASSSPAHMLVSGGRLWFTAVAPGTFRRLFSSDGSSTGTSIYAPLQSRTTQALLGVFGNQILVQVADNTARHPQLVLAGPTTTATPVTLSTVSLERPESLAGPYPSDSPSVAVSGDSLYILGTSQALGYAGPHVFKYTPPGTAVQLLSTTGPGTTAIGPAGVGVFEVAGDRVVLGAAEVIGQPADNWELWSGPTTPGVGSAPLAEINEGNTGSDLAWIRAVGRKVMFVDNSVPPRLFSGEGTPQTTSFVSNIFPDLTEELPGFGPAALNGTLVFENRTLASGLEPWISDGAPAPPPPQPSGTHLLRELAAGNADSPIDQLTPSGSLMYFRSASSGAFIFRTDLTELGTFRVTPESGAFDNLAPWAPGSLIMTGRASPADPPGLWLTDGSNTGANRIASFAWLSIGGTPLTVVQRAAPGPVAYFASGSLAPDGRELWRTDGTPSGTAQVADLQPDAASSAPEQIRSAGVRADGAAMAIFVATTADTGAELFTTDGSGPGTLLLRDIRPGPIGSAVQQLAVGLPLSPEIPGSASAARAFFVADAGASDGLRLWTTDGVPLGPGTRPLPDIRPGAPDVIRNLRVFTPPALASGAGAILAFFSADDGAHGEELWMSDGTDLGTRMVADLWPGPGSSMAVTDDAHPTRTPQITLVNSRVYFFADDGLHGAELQVLDLCPADFNNDASVGVQDVFDFLAAWFSGSDRADTDGLNGVALQDLFTWLAGWFAGC